MVQPVSFISLGPGGSDMVTLGTVRVLQECEKVYCFGSHGFSYAQETLEQLPVQIPVQVIDIPMSRDREAVWQIYRELAIVVQEEAEEGRRVCIATEGDSSVYATTHYVKDLLDEAGIPTIQYAGVPSFIGASARAGLHLISQKQRLLVVPGKITAPEIEAHIGQGNTLVIMKLSMAKEAVKAILAKHPEYHCHFFSQVGTSREEHIQDPEVLKEMKFPYFALMIIQP